MQCTCIYGRNQINSVCQVILMSVKFSNFEAKMYTNNVCVLILVESNLAIQ